MMKKGIFYLLTLILLSSCVTNKKATYLQGNLDNQNIDFPHKIYKTQVNDLLLITVTSKDAELTNFFNNLSGNSQSTNSLNINPYMQGYRIDDHGNIRLPYIGDLNVLNYSLKEIRLKVENELAKYIKNSNTFFVTVRTGGIKYTILGEIKSPGTNTLLQYEANIIDAIASSGDVTEYGNRTNIEVIRQEKKGVKKYEIDLTQLNSLSSDVFLIKNNDIINIKPIKQKPVGIGTTGLSVFNTVISTFTVILSTIVFINSVNN